LERELDDELRFHVEELTRDLMASGYDAREARRRAHIELGGVERVKEEARDARGTRWLEDLWQDTRMALRRMRRAPGFTAAAVLTIAIGVGANTAVFSLIDAVLLRALPVADPSELYLLERVGIEDDHYRFSHPAFQRLRQTVTDQGSLTAMSALTRMYATIGERPEGLLVQLIDGGWFSLLGVGASVGRPFGPEDDQVLGGHPVAVLSHRFWNQRFGGDRAVIGRTLRVNGVLLTVIGVAEAGFFGLDVGREVELWAPLAMQHELKYATNASSSNADTRQPWAPQEGIEWLRLLLRVPERSAVVQANAAVNQRFRADLIDFLSDRDSTELAFLMQERVVLNSAARGQSSLRDELADPLLVLMGSVGLVLLVACANLASLLVARGAASQHENAVRLSLGARPQRLARQVLTESLTLAVIGGTGSIIVAQWAGPALMRAGSFGAADILRTSALDVRLLAFAFGVSLLTGVAFGVTPALRAARTDLHASFKTGGRVVGDSRVARISVGRMLVVAQIALSLVLATGAGLFARTLRNVTQIDPGYEREAVVLARIDTRAAGYGPDQRASVYQELLRAVTAIPSVRSASLSNTGLAMGSRRTSGFGIPGYDAPPDWDNSAQENRVTEDFFSTVGIQLLRGRAFGPQDADGQTEATIVSQSMARHFFGTEDVLGRRFGYGTTPQFEIVGVVRDARVNELRETPPRMVYYPMRADEPEFASSLEVRISGPASSTISAIQDAIASVDADLPVREVVPVDDLLRRGLRDEELVARLAGVFGLMALVLAGIGLYGVTAFAVSRRTNEMGVRMALGAAPTGVLRLVLGDTLRLVAIGLAFGMILLVPASALVRHLVYGLSPHDPFVIGIATIVLVAVSTLAASLPAWRAARVDPVTALRAE
jgi:predicted permease